MTCRWVTFLRLCEIDIVSLNYFHKLCKRFGVKSFIHSPCAVMVAKGPRQANQSSVLLSMFIRIHAVFSHPALHIRRLVSQLDGAALSQPSGLAFGFQEAQDIVFADGTLDVADDASGGVVHELDPDLRHTTAGSGASKDTGYFNELDRLLGRIHLDCCLVGVVGRII